MLAFVTGLSTGGLSCFAVQGGLYLFDTGLDLAGALLSAGRLLAHFQAAGSAATLSGQDSLDPGSLSEISIEASDRGYTPSLIVAPAGKTLHVSLVTRNTESCARGFTIPALNYEKALPAEGVVKLDIPPQPVGSRLFFSCSMGMYTGEFHFQ